MSVRVEIPFEALAQPGVAQALAALMLSLGANAQNQVSQPITAKKPAEKTARKKAPRTSARSRRGATATDLSGLPPAERWRRYVDGRPQATIQFLALLEDRGSLTVDDAVAELGLASPKAMGGMTGAMARWAPKQGVDLPFEARQDSSGNRFWVWNGFEQSAAA